jgi:hypothetical protein
MPEKDPVWLEIFKQELRTTSSFPNTTRISAMDEAEPPRSKNSSLPSNLPQTTLNVLKSTWSMVPKGVQENITLVEPGP